MDCSLTQLDMNKIESHLTSTRIRSSKYATLLYEMILIAAITIYHLYLITIYSSKHVSIHY